MGVELFARIKEVKNVKEIRELTELAMNCWRESREIVENATSCKTHLIFLEGIVRKGEIYRGIPFGELWKVYKEFCKRNGFLMVPESEFELDVKELLGEVVSFAQISFEPTGEEADAEDGAGE